MNEALPVQENNNNNNEIATDYSEINTSNIDISQVLDLDNNKRNNKNIKKKDKNNDTIVDIPKRNDQTYVATLCSLYVFFLIIFLIWTINILWERWNQIINPVSSNGFDLANFNQLLYPAVTICNVNPNINVEHKNCKSFETNIQCDYKETYFRKKGRNKSNNNNNNGNNNNNNRKEINYLASKTNTNSTFLNSNLNSNKKEDLNFQIKKSYKDKDLVTNKLKVSNNNNYTKCLTYNSNLDSAFVATKQGIQDMLFIAVSINLNDYPDDSFLNGVLISLHSQGVKPQLDNGMLASPGKIFMIRLKKVVNEYLNMTSVESFEGQISSLNTPKFVKTWGNDNDTVVIGLTYQDLNVMIIRELPPFTILTFLSETGGILGLLLGSSLASVTIALVQWAWGLRLNEYHWFGIKNADANKNNNDSNNNIYNNIDNNIDNNGNYKKEKEIFLDDNLNPNKNNNNNNSTRIDDDEINDTDIKIL